MKLLMALFLIVAELLFGLPRAFAATTTVVTPGGWDLYLGSALAKDASGARLPPFSTELACIDGAKARSTAVRVYSYTCRTRTGVVVTVTNTTPPPPPPTCALPRPADELQAIACPSGTVGQWSQSRTYSCPQGSTVWAASAWSPTAPAANECPAAPGPNPDPTVGMFTDLASAPACARVTIYPARTVVDASAAGIPIHAGNCLEATPATFNKTFWNNAKCGDVITLRAGTYTQTFGEGTWYFAMGETYRRCPKSQPLAVVAYPGEVATLKSTGRPPLMFGNGTQNSAHAEWLTFAGLAIVGTTGDVSGGGDSTQPSGGPDESGGVGIRLVGNAFSITDKNQNTMSALVDVSADGWKILGNTFIDDPARQVIKNNHVVYINGGADDVEVAYNTFVGLHVGHVVQVHQDGTPKLYERISIHDNYFRAINYGDMRGISVVNVGDGSSISLVKNTFEHVGQGSESDGYWGCLNVYGGNVTVDQLSCTDVYGGINFYGRGASYGGNVRKIVMSNSKVCPVKGQRLVVSAGAVASDVTETGAKACP